jgi:hypothetical protein
MTPQGFGVWESDDDLLNFAVAHMFVEDLQIVVQKTRAFSGRGSQLFVLVILGGAGCGLLYEYLQYCLQVRGRS